MNTQFSDSGSADNDHRGEGRRPTPVVPDHTLLRVIGRGSYGEVWLARNVMGTHRAVKVVYRDTFDSDQPYQREFDGIRKFEAISRAHESQLDLLHIGRNDQAGYFYYVMELADDATLGDAEDPTVATQPAASDAPPPASPREPAASGLLADERSRAFDWQGYAPLTLQEHLKRRGRLPFDTALQIALALANALRHLHQHGLVHRDIKPSNIIFVHGLPKLADIGLVTESNRTVTYVGAQGYMAPEGPGRVPADLYSLGKVIYEMCTGRDRMDFPALPADFGTWADRQPMFELQTVSLKACDPDSANRHASAEELAAELVMLQAGKSVRRLRLLERGRKWAVAVIVVALLGVAGAWIRERARVREVRTREAQMVRMGEHIAGWSTNAWGLLRQAARIRMDHELRTEAAATLAGLDARLVQESTDFGAVGVAWDRQGRRLLLNGGSHGPSKLWDAQEHTSEDLETSGEGLLAFGPDDLPIELCPGGTNALVLRELRSKRELRRFVLPIEYSTPDWGLYALARSADGAYIAARLEKTNGTNGRVLAWQAATGNLVGTISHQTVVMELAPDGSCLAIGDADGHVQVLSLPELKQLAAFEGDRAGVNCLAFGEDPLVHGDAPSAKPGWLLAAGDAGGTIRIYSLARRSVQTICHGSAFNVVSLCFSPDRMTLVSGGRVEVRCWDIATGATLLILPGWIYVDRLAVSPDGRRLAVGAAVEQPPWKRAAIYEMEPARGVLALRGFSSQATGVRFSGDGKKLAAISHNWRVGLWDLEQNRLEHLWDAPKGLLADNGDVAFDASGRSLAFATYTNACLWDLGTGQKLGAWSYPGGLQQRLAFDASGRLLLFQYDWPTERICRLRALRSDGSTSVLHEWSDFNGRGRVSRAVLPLGGAYAVGGGECVTNGIRAYVAKVFDLRTGERLLECLAGKGGIDRVAIDREGRYMTYVTTNGRSQILELPSGRAVASVDSVVNAVSVGAEAVACEPGRGPMVRLLRGRPLAVEFNFGHLSHLVPPDFSPDGRQFAWGTTEGLVYVGDLPATFQRLDEL